MRNEKARSFIIRLHGRPRRQSRCVEDGSGAITLEVEAENQERALEAAKRSAHARGLWALELLSLEEALSMAGEESRE